MKSSELRKIKKVILKKKKKILLISPKKKNYLGSNFPHNGLAVLAGILKKRGHDVLVVDYSFLHGNAPDISFFIDKLKPDIVGVSIYAFTADSADGIISKIYDTDPRLPIMVGGPFPTLYSDILKKNKKIDYIFIGEAELTLLDVVEKAKKNKISQIIQTSELLNLNDIPPPDYKAFYRWESIRHYPIMTSRGCPHKCSFCSGIDFTPRTWRFRNNEECIKELEDAKREIYPLLDVFVFDDCPTAWKKKFYEFLELYAKRVKSKLIVINTRADQIDDIFLGLLKKANCSGICLGVEHAHPEVFKLVNKGETLEQIETACKLVKKQGMDLALSFIIGLPGDNLQRTKVSINFLKRMGAKNWTINLIIPYRGTVVREWFEKNGRILRSEIGAANDNLEYFECEEPYVETPDFSSWERKKAYYTFSFKAVDIMFKIKKIKKIFSIANKYGLYNEFFYWLPRGFLKNLLHKKTSFMYALEIYKKEGFNELIRRYLNRIKMYQ